MTDEKLKRLFETKAERIEKPFDRMRYVEQSLATLADRFAGLQTRVDRLEETTKSEN
jgi:hypothetical protein